MTLPKTFIKKITKQLNDQRQDIISMDTSIEIDTAGDETDGVQGNMLIAMTKQLNSRNQAKLMQINGALKRLENHTYGLCEECEEEIPQKRLLANPYVMTCISCAEERELEEKRRSL